MLPLALCLLCLPSFSEETTLRNDEKTTPLLYRADLRLCPKCNHRNATTDRYCRRCGSALKK